MKKTLLDASFEESLNLYDDPSYKKFGKPNFESAQETEKYRGTFKGNWNTFWWSLLLIFGVNYLFAVISNMIYHLPSEKTSITGSPINFFPYWIFYLLAFLWLLIVILGKRFKFKFILTYRTQFHIFVTYFIWLLIEFNLLLLNVFYGTLGILGVGAIYFSQAVIIGNLFNHKIKSLSQLLYGQFLPSRLDRAFSFLARYFWIVVIILTVLKWILEGWKGMDGLGVLGTLSIWFITNIGILTLQIYLFLPFFLQGYYKWKYPEEYREWEGKTTEEWY
ncbi:TPA: hypothetical protein TZS69_001976 [Streptococcus suis]|nr:hypothetical protein [Streptococcus suis]